MGGNLDTAVAECQKLCSTCSCSEDDYIDETPIHTVLLDAFYMDIYEVTNARYAECVKAGGCAPPSNSGSSSRNSYYGDTVYDHYPVIYVNWQNALSYCAWRGARLPTEAEWEKAARGGLEGKSYPWGNTLDGSLANFCDANCLFNWSNKNFDDGYTDTSPVGIYPPNAFGLYDIAGNVWEWVNDWYGGYGSFPVENPTGPETGTSHVVRGGSWHSYVDNLRVSLRYWLDPVQGKNDFGFRCARSP